MDLNPEKQIRFSSDELLELQDLVELGIGARSEKRPPTEAEREEYGDLLRKLRV